ncbi:MAG: hypothetical protein NC400_03295 [Clostridium sp.]|nr:hypothetical protein [Clostridium sp.]
MSYTKRKLEELNVMDDFLMNRLASDRMVGEEFCRVLLSTLLQKEIGRVSVTVQKVIPAFAPDRKGIRLDVRVDEFTEQQESGKAVMNIYDIEPHFLKEMHLPKRNRFYQAMTDSGLMKSGKKEYVFLPNLYILTILDKDPFGFDYMMYSIRNKCEEIKELEYEDGLQFYYFYTDGKRGGNEAIKTMLHYIKDSRWENATDEATRKLHGFTENVKVQPEVRKSYMFWEEYVEIMKEEEALDTLLDLLSDYGEIPEETAERLHRGNDLKTLRRWIKLAAKSSSMADFVARM